MLKLFCVKAHFKLQQGQSHFFFFFSSIEGKYEEIHIAAKETHLYKCKQYQNQTNSGKAFVSFDCNIMTNSREHG